MKLASDVSWPKVEFAPEPPPAPPLEIHDGFEDYPPGSSPANAQVQTENKGDSIGVSDELAATGKHCLKVVDAAGLTAPSIRISSLHPAIPRGRRNARLICESVPASVFYHEWRDDAQPYRVGPSLWIRNGELTAGGKKLLDLPADTWVHFEISAALGDASAKTWDLSVTLPGQSAQHFPGLANGSPDWSRLSWLGFVSNATEKTTYYLDNLQLTGKRGLCCTN